MFITFEGGEGCGKSLQSKRLYSRLVKGHVSALLTHEPGGTPVGRRIARILKDSGAQKMPPLTELLLFNASRTALVEDVIRPALKKGEVVVCDRFTDSTLAYQSYGRGLDGETVRFANAIATGGLMPDLTILLDIPPEEGLARKAKSKPVADRFEREALAFHRRVRAGYLELAALEPERWVVIDARKPKDGITATIWEHIAPLVKKNAA